MSEAENRSNPVDKPRNRAISEGQRLSDRLQLAAQRIAGRTHAASQLRRLEDAVAALEALL